MKDIDFTVSFLTENNYKFFEAKEALSPFPCVSLIQLKEHKTENKDDSLLDPIKSIAINASIEAAKRHKCLVVAEDSGVFFEAFENFPGMNTKWVIKQIGYDGILNLMSGVSNRSAYFRSVIALSNERGIINVFEGIIRGRIADKVYGENIDCMDYDRIFIPEGSDIPFSLMLQNKKKICHRYIAFHNLGLFLSGLENHD